VSTVGAAVEMVDNLMRYLSEALPKLRQEESSLADELQLVDAYLRIHQIRNGDAPLLRVARAAATGRGPDSHHDAADPGGKRREAWDQSDRGRRHHPRHRQP
jgi:hypothetical protein